MIRRLLIFNGLAIVCAVTNHALVWELTAMSWWADRYLPPDILLNHAPLESWRFFMVKLIQQIVFFAVFVFLFISGYFEAIAAGRQQKTVPWKLVLRRVKFLIIPYLVWTAVILVLNVLQGQSYTAWEIVKIILLGGASPPYYYVILLIQLYLLSPLLVPFARNRWRVLLLITGILQLFVLAAHYAAILGIEPAGLEPLANILRAWQLIGYAFWFFLGTTIGFHLREFSARIARWRWFILFGMIVAFIIGFIEWNMLMQLSSREWISPQVLFFNRVFVLLVLLAFIAFDNWVLPFPRLFNRLGPKSYGIYLIHVIVLEATARLVYHVAPGLLAFQFLFLPVLVVVGVGVPVFMMEVFDHAALRKYYKYIFG
jgi:peptidoglycan/LPS O-acetylase OafA/YrhL